MRGASRIAVLAAITAVLLLAGLIAPATVSAGGSIDVLLDDLLSPKGLSLNPARDLVIGQGAFGAEGPVLIYDLNSRGRAEEISEPLHVIDLVATADGGGWALVVGDFDVVLLVRHSPDGTDTVVANITEYQQTNPDPFDTEGNPTESNPFGIGALPSGDALVVDAAMNNLLRVTPQGDVTTVARFDVEEVSTDHLPGEEPPPPGEPPLPTTIDAESVPTSVALGGDGSVYVGELKGFPFRPGSSRVWRVDPDAEGAVCSVDIADADCDFAWSGFTGIADIAFHQRTGTLYVYEYAEEGVLAFEGGFETGDFPPAVLLEVKKNKRTELAAGNLSQPGGIVVTNRGHVYVTDGMFTCSGPEAEAPCEGRLVEVHR